MLFDYLISRTCDEYFTEHPEYYPNKLVQVQYIINAYKNDISAPPGIYEIVDELQHIVTRDDVFYNDVQKYIQNISLAQNRFEENDGSYIYTVNGLYAFSSYTDAMTFVEDYMLADWLASEMYNPLVNDVNIILSKVKLYNEDMGVEKYTDDFHNYNSQMVINGYEEIIYVYDPMCKLCISDSQEYPELSKFQTVYLPYKQGDILKRRGISHEYQNNKLTYMMMYDWNSDGPKPNPYADIDQMQISMGEFSYSDRMFFYDHLTCIFDFDTVDPDTLIDPDYTQFFKSYFNMIKEVSLKMKKHKLKIDDAFTLCIRSMNKFVYTLNNEFDYWTNR